MAKRTYAGLFILTLTTLMYEILLTRIFSVTMYYHFVFLAISIAMFGLTVGGLVVYLYPGLFTQEKVERHLAISALGFAISMVTSFVLYLGIPAAFDLTALGIALTVMTLALISVPFAFSGTCVCLALTKIPGKVSQLYAADLTGAALGCILVIYLLRFIDGPSAVIVTAALSCISAYFFSSEAKLRRLSRVALVCTLLLIAFAAVNSAMARDFKSPLRIYWQHGEATEDPIYEIWNSYSRVIVFGNPNRWEEPTTWGMSPAYHSDENVRQLHMIIDSTAATVITAFNGDLSRVGYLKYDVTNIVHYLRSDSRVVVIGAGGGRDVLSALDFGQKTVTAIEMNDGIIKAINGPLGDFTGHLDRNPRVSFINDEARSYLAKHAEKTDIIQISLIDTWAATMAGAFALTENSLYTVEAWRLFLDRLTPRGILSVTRWYRLPDPVELYRLVSLARAALISRQVKNPVDHIVIVRRMFHNPLTGRPDGVATILVSREPFSADDLATLHSTADKMGFDVTLGPREAANSTFATLASGKNLSQLLEKSRARLDAPTDESPFFLCPFRVRDVFNDALGRSGSRRTRQMDPLFTLSSLVIGVTVLVFLCIIVPLILSGDKSSVKGTMPLFIFFAAIGLGYMLVEISQLQRLMVFLGHPTYSLSTVLFTLLLSSGLGSYATQDAGKAGSMWRPERRLLVLLGVLVLFGLLTPHAINTFISSKTPIRVMVSAVTLFPLGFLMGMAFPLGMKVASAHSEAVTPWLWGLNGAMSVVASVIAFLIVLGAGISTAFWTGFFSYSIAFVAYLWAVRAKHAPPT